MRRRRIPHRPVRPAQIQVPHVTSTRNVPPIQPAGPALFIKNRHHHTPVKLFIPLLIEQPASLRLRHLRRTQPFFERPIHHPDFEVSQRRPVRQPPAGKIVPPRPALRRLRQQRFMIVRNDSCKDIAMRQRIDIDGLRDMPQLAAKADPRQPRQQPQRRLPLAHTFLPSHKLNHIPRRPARRTMP